MEENLKSKAIKNSFWNAIATLSNKIGAFVFTIILARFLLPYDLGVYSLATAIAIFFLSFTDLGLNQAAIRYVSAELKIKKKSAAYFNYLLKIKLLSVLAFLIILIVISYPLSVYVFRNPGLFLPILISAIFATLAALSGFFESVLYAINKLKYIALKGFTLEVLKIGFVLLIFKITSSAFHIYGTIIALIISIAIIFGFIIFILKKEASFIFIKTKTSIDKIRVWHFIKYSIMASISVLFFAYADTIILGIFVTPDYIGLYKVASNLIFGVAGLLSLTNIFLPIFARLKKESLENAFNKTLKYAMVLIIPAAFGLAALSKYFILLFGHAYLTAWPILTVLSFVIIPFAGVSLFSALFSATERLKEFAKLTIFMTILNVILNLILISTFLQFSQLAATIGASISILFSWLVYFIGLFIISKKKLNIQADWKVIVKPLISSIIMFLILYLIVSNVKDMTLIYGALSILLGILVYFLSLLIIKGISFEDVKMIKLVLAKSKLG